MAIFRRTHNRLRAHRLARTPPGPVRDYLAEPFPALGTLLDELPLLAIDLETTGLDPTTDRILSIGFIPVDGRGIPVAAGRELIVAPRTAAGVGDSATVHGLTDDRVAAGMALTNALTETLRALAGRVLLAHHASIEIGFLDHACGKAFPGSRPAFAAVDTLALGSDLLMVGDDDIPQGRLRLSSLRAQFGLPRYRAHRALTDALACAELYLALTAEMGQKTLGQIILK